MRLVFTILTVVALSFMQAQNINIEESIVEWTGKKITGEHQGTIQIQQANLKFDGDQLVSGTIVMDMSSITVTDLEGEKAAKLESHLKNEDFFDVNGFPEAELTFNKVQHIEGHSYQIFGELTIKGITNDISFYANLKEDNAAATLKIDRSKYDIRYGSSSFFDNLGDNVIDDIFTIKAHLVYL